MISQRFKDKGYPKGLIEVALHKASSLTEEQCLAPKSKNSEKSKERLHFITTYNKSFTQIQGALRKHILTKDPYVRAILPSAPQITYRRPPTRKKFTSRNLFRFKSRVLLSVAIQNLITWGLETL